MRGLSLFLIYVTIFIVIIEKKIMKKKEIIIIGVVIFLLLGGLVGLKFYKKYEDKKNVLTINTALSMTVEQQQLYDEARLKLEEDPDDYSALFQLANLKQAMLDRVGAISLYEKLLTIKPDDILVLHNLGNIYYDLGRYEEAEKIELEILEKTPKWTAAYQELMMIYQFHLTDRRGKLESLLLKGLNLVPEAEVDFVSLLAKYYDELMPDKEKALEYYSRLVKLQTQNQDAQKRVFELKNIK